MKKIIPAVLIIALFALLIMLGFWQLSRADEKKILLQEVKTANVLPARYIPTQQIIAQEHHNILLNGEYLSDFQLIYDNQIVNSKSGYYVLTPFKVKKDNSVVLVNRGFIPWGGYRQLQDISIQNVFATLTGKIQLAKTRIKLKNTSQKKTFPIVIQTLDFDVIDNLLGFTVIRSIILLDSDQDNGYHREWKLFYGSIDKHLGYALQWFMMAFVLFVIGILLLKKLRKTNK